MPELIGVAVRLVIDQTVLDGEPADIFADFSGSWFAATCSNQQPVYIISIVYVLLYRDNFSWKSLP